MAAALGDLFSELGQSLLSSAGLVFLVLGVVVPAAVNVYIRRREKRRVRKKLLYNVLLNSRLGLDPPDAGDVVRLNDRNDDPIEQPSLAVVRITNDSESDIAEDDYRADTRVQFDDGAVRTVDVTDAHPSELSELISEGIKIEDNAVILPRKHLNAGERFKLLILLSGGGGRPDDVKVTGLIRGGDVVDARRPRSPAARRWRVATVVIASLSLGALLAAGLLYYAGPRPGQFPPHCSKGSLVVGGSSAFATATAQVAGSYSSYCTRAAVQVMPSNSQQGMDDLQASIAGNHKQQRVAMSDGRADPSVTAGTAEHAVAIVPYAIVLNPKVFAGATGPVNLSTAQVREIFGGTQKTWRDIDPRFAPLPVKIVARGQSGSRIAFERYVLGNGVQQSSQGQRTSTNCVDQDYVGNNQTFLCEESSTGAVIDRVRQLDGAVGYADAPDVTAAGASLLTVALDGHGDGLPDIVGGYPFWTVEHAYFRANGDELAANFVDYLTSPAQESALQTGGYPPCSANRKLCATR
ncbi:PstS family phosphate ABC transporter substrate-binding protein [Rugosimonospora africana]|uniref:Phosphate ABC transporter substrate-binding protein n=1 Tax=Rugosimonospora africana TaxID=556532 RepID=A0A8J3R1N2_9ACTN|nr:substrate-binding domain-containing protein [Rugosimonospora africana]GIH20581.1 phosphate ABC transporter substrate-binding protein [Rugosimonospora africana]